MANGIMGAALNLLRKKNREVISYTILSLAYILLMAEASKVLAQQSLPDPTRPPVTGLPTAPTIGETGAPRLQSVILPKRGKPLAIIDGQQVTLGDTISGARVVAITESAVKLEGPDGPQTLKMAPDVEKKLSGKHKQNARPGVWESIK